MQSIVSMVFEVTLAAWDILVESSPFILFGFFIAGLLKGFIPDDLIKRHLGGASKSSIVKASLFGVPIPLCSCGVIPAAAGLREQGASKGAVTSFMISTPETGVDSMAVTYALLDPVMTVIRPVAAFITAMVSGLFVNIFDKETSTKAPVVVRDPFSDLQTLPMSMGDAIPDTCCGESQGPTREMSKLEKLKSGMRFAFGGLLTDIGSWLLVGVLLAGIITVVISPEFISSYLGDGILSMLLMIALATPLYVCATASTPIAAALALKGLSPGAALVFLLAGPATNMATITVVARLLGKKTAAIYLTSIMASSLILGLLVNWLYLKMGISIAGWVNTTQHSEHGILYTASAVTLVLLIVKPWVLKLFYNVGLTSAPAHAHHNHHNNCDCSH